MIGKHSNAFFVAALVGLLATFLSARLDDVLLYAGVSMPPEPGTRQYAVASNCALLADSRRTFDVIRVSSSGPGRRPSSAELVRLARGTKWSTDSKIAYGGALVTMHADMIVHAQGWPMRAFAAHARDDRGPFSGGVVLMIRGQSRVIAYSPEPVGLVFNTLVYAAAALVLRALVHRARAWVRRARQRCPNCAYPSTGLVNADHCPECGQAIA